MFNFTKFLILKILADRDSPMAISSINAELSKIKHKKVKTCHTKKEFQYLQIEGKIHYCYDGKKVKGTNWIIITDKGKEYYKILIYDFIKEYRYINSIYELIKDDIPNKK